MDEFQHFQDRDRNKILKNVANYLKEIIIRTNKPMILTGMPYSVGILDDNPQLNRRFKRASLDPLNGNHRRKQRMSKGKANLRSS